jgi:hypothetical protein
MNIKRPLMPGFLKRAEQKLLLNKPGIWSTRAHLVVYYGVLFLLVLTTLCFLEPNDPRARSTTEAWIGFTSIIAGIGLIVWMIYLLRFNVFKKYGTIHPLHALVTFLLYFISTGIIVSFGYVHPVVETVRANMAYSDKEVVDDINDINTKIYQLEYNQLQDKWDYDTVALIKKDTAVATAVAPSDNVETEEYNETPAVASKHNYYQELDSAEFNNKINATDSLIKLKDSVYLVYKTPSFRFLAPYLYYSKVKERLLSDFELFRKVHGHPPTTTQREIINQELSVLLKKYEYPDHTNYPVEVARDDSHWDIIQKKYRIGDVDNSISHVFRKKYRWSGDHLEVYLRIFYYLTLGITLLIFIFRHTTVRTFFLSILAGVIITIITALVASFTRAEAVHILGCLIAYVFLFFFVSLTVFRAKKRSAIPGIALNLFVFIVKLLPLLILVWYYEYKQNQLREVLLYNEPFDMDKYIIYTEIAGSVLLLVLIATYISKVYRRWYSLPEN